MITLNSFIDSCDICFIQEHWLSNALLHKIGEISQDFVCTSVSGTGCPSSGVLSTIKRRAKKRYKFDVRRIKCRCQYLIRDRLAHSFTKRK